MTLKTVGIFLMLLAAYQSEGSRVDELCSKQSCPQHTFCRVTWDCARPGKFMSQCLSCVHKDLDTICNKHGFYRAVLVDNSQTDRPLRPMSCSIKNSKEGISCPSGSTCVDGVQGNFGVCCYDPVRVPDKQCDKGDSWRKPQCDFGQICGVELFNCGSSGNPRPFVLPEMGACESTQLVPFQRQIHGECPPLVKMEPHVCESSNLFYRSIDGSCNNLDHPDWGRAFQPPKRLVPPAYGDGKGFPRYQSVTNKPLRNARFISRTVLSQTHRPAGHSTMVMSWGQFVDHDFTGFPVTIREDGAITCCVDKLDPALQIKNGGPCFPIRIDKEENFFRGRDCMELVRSTPALDENDIPLSPREQINSITAYLDASVVYGSTEEVNERLRAPDGKLRVADNNMLPSNGEMNCRIVDNTTDYCLFAGDARVNVHVGIGVLHTIFHRQHNLLVDGLKKINPQWTAEQLYQEARSIVIAIYQHITYSEYIATLLNDDTLKKYRLKVGDFSYDKEVRADIANVFSTAALRFGHSQIPQFVTVGSDSFATHDTLLRPHLVLTRFEEVAEGIISSSAETVDRFIVNSLTQRLFETNSTDRDGLDLMALNVQRARDHGLPSYNEYRKFCKLDPATSFKAPDFKTGHRLEDAYEHPDDIDVFIGAVLENPLDNSFVGPLLSCLLGQQFHDSKFGDRFFYEAVSPTHGFTFDQLKEIKKQSLASVMCANTKLKQVQKHIMLLPDEYTNPPVYCARATKIDLSKWKEQVYG